MKRTILIVEDEPQIQKILSSSLKESGFEVIQAKHGKEGLEKALKKHPNLVLLDIIMPIMDGLTMLKQLRDDSWGRDVPVIILTNLSDAGKINDALKEGVFDFLVKSDWKLEEVIKKIKNRLK